MKVAIGAVAGTLGGPATYAIELSRALAARFASDRFVVLTDCPEAFPSGIETRRLPLGAPWRQAWWDHVAVPRALARERFDLYHGTKGTLPRRGRTPAVVTVHDLASHTMPETFHPLQRLHLRWETPWAVAHARRILVPSRSTAADLERYFPASGPRIHVTPEAPAAGLRPASAAEVAAWRERHGIAKPACGYLGTLQPRKNLDLLVRAFLAAAGSRDWRLIIAGRTRPGYDSAGLRSDPRVVVVGPIDEREKAAFFGSIRAMVSPSAYEGFGLTFAEAMACGCPVVALRNSSLPEVVGDAGVLVDDASEPALAAAIEKLMTDDRAAAELSRKGRERAASFSWNETARLTREAYERAVGSGGAASESA